MTSRINAQREQTRKDQRGLDRHMDDPSDIAALVTYAQSLEAKIERLRAALSLISNHELRDHEDYTAIQDIAEEALK